LLGSIFKVKGTRKDLIRNILTLAEGFTMAKSDRVKGYMGRPEFLSAYLHWYLPWNLIKLSHVLTQVRFDPPTQVTDYGAGPLTFALAVLLVHPEWAENDMGWSLVEPQVSSMTAGLDLLEAVAEKAGLKLAWKWTKIHGRLGEVIKRRADWVSAIHVWNETPLKSEAFLPQIRKYATEKAVFWVAEPGDRSGGKKIFSLRSRVLEEGLPIHAPCTHRASCPATGEGPGSRFCHFPTYQKIPDWLFSLTADLGFAKERNPVSYLVFGGSASKDTKSRARIISDPLHLETGEEFRYACGKEGLLLVPEARSLTSGRVFLYEKSEKFDKKTSGLFVYEN